ncbi:MAG: transcriptional regulator [Bdellovibrionales bacterium CG12_big_fil_rev_8_21_14_0_65_38_15]|nr:MAG: transcriptional regulator [Bdellovibrionales bacterium CG22_combo_CG10-13_8_21_14_all_38_13]PIQ52385.1 MAG: transcriptional regulator [Bdellovibrionales bacterium CG12_big_fil_rev_8_21_14_0_65_38_15]PIR29424.1 MAG: transcriptional regulator [Bdellovibrionales bacterium CG11_big_fil_rev_8_21_14_0_20_38_13]
MQIESIKDLVEEIKKRRNELGISQVQLAQLCDLSVNGISKFESNAGEREVKLSTLFKLSEVLGFKLVLDFENE